jgi:hypothetical protein
MEASPAGQPNALATEIKKELIAEFINSGFSRPEAKKLASEAIVTNWQLFT